MFPRRATPKGGYSGRNDQALRHQVGCRLHRFTAWIQGIDLHTGSEEIVVKSFASLLRDGCGLRLVGVHVKIAEVATTHVKAPSRADTKHQVPTRPWSWLCCTLAQWTMEIIQPTWIEMREMTAEVDYIDESCALLLRLRLVQVRLEARTLSQQAVLNWRGLSLSVGIGGLFLMSGGGHALVGDLEGDLEVDMHIAAPFVHVPATAESSALALFTVFQRYRQHESRAAKEKIYHQATVRVTTLGKTQVVFEDQHEVGNLVICDLRLVCMSQTLVARALVAELRASATLGKFNGLAVRIKLPQWTAQILQGSFSTSDVANCSYWGARCLKTFQKLSEFSSADHTCADAPRGWSNYQGNVLMPSMRIQLLCQDCCLSATLKGTVVSITLVNRCARWAVEVLEGSLEVNGQCFLMLEMDTSGTRTCCVESLQGVPYLFPPSAQSTAAKEDCHAPTSLQQSTRYVIDVPRIWCFVSGVVISALVAGFQDLAHLVGTDGSKPIVSLYIAAENLVVCLADDKLRRDSFHNSFAEGDVWPQPCRDCLVVAAHGIIARADHQTVEFQVSDARVNYDDERLVCKRPKANLLLLGEYIAAPSAVVSLSLRGLAWRASAPHSRIAVLINSLGSSVGSATLASPSLVSKWHIALYDTFLEYTSPPFSHYDSHVILTIGVSRVNFMSSHDVTSMSSGTARDMTLFLKNIRADSNINVRVIPSEDLVQIATVDVLDITLASDGMLPAKRRCINLDGGIARCYCCSDSFQTLVVLFTVAKYRVSELREASSGGNEDGKADKNNRNRLDSVDSRSASTFTNFLVSALSQSRPTTTEPSAMHHSDTKCHLINVDQLETFDAHSKLDTEARCINNNACEALWYDGLPPRIIIDHVSVPDVHPEIVSETIRLQAQVEEVHLSFFAGCDWLQVQIPHQINKEGSLKKVMRHQEIKGQREVNRLVRIVVLHARCHISSWPGQVLGDICVADFVVSESISSNKDRKLRPVLEHWRSESVHPRETNEGLLQLHLYVNGQVTAIKVKMLPLRCCLDARVVGFSQTFFGSTPVGFTNLELPPEEHESKIVIMDVASLALKLDYNPSGNRTQMYSGAVRELSRAFSLERVQVTTRRCRVVSKTVTLALDNLWQLWSSELSEEQMHKFVFGASVVRPVHAVGASIADVIHCPLETNPRKNRWRLLKREFAACGRVLVYEFARASRYFATNLAVAIDAAADNLEGQHARNQAFDDSMDHGDTYPHLKGACRAICQGLDETHGACVAMIARPSVSTLAKGAPIAILRPTAGLSRSIAILLLGIEQSADTQA
mmetsp:Transcript_32674/g.101111  ORF Transcript_32674/g.101111 Transcript_32674/m.101111 type:complete len:1302 (-) Transcript_32674:653-4558(-)